MALLELILVLCNMILIILIETNIAKWKEFIFKWPDIFIIYYTVIIAKSIHEQREEPGGL